LTMASTSTVDLDRDSSTAVECALLPVLALA
jgi:hypothetical protein